MAVMGEILEDVRINFNDPSFGSRGGIVWIASQLTRLHVEDATANALCDSF